MAVITYYVVMPFGRDEEGNLCPGEAIEAPSAVVAKSRAARLATQSPGAVAFSRTGDTSTGEFDDAVVIARYGEVPGDVAEYVL